MKIVQINCVYNVGSTGKIVYDLHSSYIKKGYNSFVIYGRGKKEIDSNVFKVSSEFEAKVHSLCSKLFGIDFGFSPIATRKAIRIINKIKPDIVHLHCLNGHFINVYRLFNYLKRNNIKTVLTLHAEIMHTAGCEHAMYCEKWRTFCYDCNLIKGKFSSLFRDDAKYCFFKMKKSVEKFDNFCIVGVSDWLTNRAICSPIFANFKYATIGNGLDCSIFNYDKFSKKQYEKLHNKYKNIVLFVTPNFNHPLKGGRYLIELANQMKDTGFVIVGFNSNVQLPNNIAANPAIKSKEELATYYANCELTILLSERETFSMVVAESLCCGTPVVGFKAGGPESIALDNCCKFVEYGDITALKNTVLTMLENEFNHFEISLNARKKYSKEKMVNEYLNVYKFNELQVKK